MRAVPVAVAAAARGVKELAVAGLAEAPGHAAIGHEPEDGLVLRAEAENTARAELGARALIQAQRRLQARHGRGGLLALAAIDGFALIR